MLKPCRLLLLLLVRLSYHTITASLCLGGGDIFASVRENSPMGEFVAILSFLKEPGANTVRLCVTGENAEWFYLEGRTIRLNSSASRVLDREVLGALLIAQLTCYEDDVIRTHNRIVVEILDENDNRPKFLLETAQPFTISEVRNMEDDQYPTTNPVLTTKNSVAFTVKAVDADGDKIRYIIDPTSRDAIFFRIDLPNSGKVVLDKPLDFETRSQLQVIIWAQEENTEEKFNTSAVVTVNVQDGDDQYPHFLPCTPVSPGVPVCMNPTYMANITHQQQDGALVFSPGPIRGEDGDRGINTPLTYAILSGDEDGTFVINSRTGDITLTRPLTDRQLKANFSLSVMVCQVNDPLKYSVASVVIRVLSDNMFPPVFNRTTFKGFIIQSSSPASIVSTYGNQVLQVQASDRDFPDGLNPNLHYSLHPPSRLYQVTQGGVLIARTDQLYAFDRHILQVRARDQESGEEASASVDIEVLQRGHPGDLVALGGSISLFPHGAFTEQPLFGDVESKLAGGITAVVLLMFLSSALFLLIRTMKRRRRSSNEHTTVGKHPNVVSSSRTVLTVDESLDSRVFRQEYESPLQSESLHGVYTRRLSLLPPSSSSANVIISSPGTGSRLQSDRAPVPEKPSGYLT